MEIALIVLLALAVLAGIVVAFRASRRGRALEHPEVRGEPIAPPAPTVVVEPPITEPEVVAPPEPEVIEKARLRDRLGKTRSALSGYLRSVRGHKIDDDTWDELGPGWRLWESRGS